MCGIAGIWGEGRIEPMLNRLIHRGPDDVGIHEAGPVKFGIRRLAIIDLATGNQPVHDETGRHWLVLNGTIFNYRELRQELKSRHHFLTQSDTEVLVHGFEEYGPEFVHKLNGMFAICWWDGQKIRLFRDRMGEKPLYYYHKDQRFIFASEIKSLLALVKAEPNLPESYEIFDSPVGSETFFKDIHSLLPGSRLTYDGQTISQKTYWSITPKTPLQRQEQDYVEELRWLIADATRLRLVSDVPVGLFLSGGLDSAIIACLARPSVVFSCNFPLGAKFDELAYAQLVARHIGAEHLVTQPTERDFQQNLKQVIYSLDMPIATASSIAEFALANLARDRVKVVLGGQGADEIFGGYIRYALMLEEQRLQRLEIFQNYHSLMRYFWSERLSDPPWKRYLYLIQRGGLLGGASEKKFAEHFEQFPNLIDAMGASDILYSLPALLTMNDRAAASVGLENRCPFLDHRIVEFAFQLPPELKVREHTTKYILRQAARGLIPDEIIDRKDKKGLVVPFNQWLSGPLREWADREIAHLKTREYLRARPTLFRAGERGEFDRKRYSWLSLELWFQNFIDPAA